MSLKKKELNYLFSIFIISKKKKRKNCKTTNDLTLNEKFFVVLFFFYFVGNEDTVYVEPLFHFFFSFNWNFFFNI